MKDSSENKKGESFEISELIMVKPEKNDRKRKFAGTIKEICDLGNKVFFGHVIIIEGWIIGISDDKDKLSTVLNTMCKLKLDCHLHTQKLKTFKYPDTSLN